MISNLRLLFDCSTSILQNVDLADSWLPYPVPFRVLILSSHASSSFLHSSNHVHFYNMNGRHDPVLLIRVLCVVYFLYGSGGQFVGGNIFPLISSVFLCWKIPLSLFRRWWSLVWLWTPGRLTVPLSSFQIVTGPLFGLCKLSIFVGYRAKTFVKFFIWFGDFMDELVWCPIGLCDCAI